MRRVALRLVYQRFWTTLNDIVSLLGFVELAAESELRSYFDQDPEYGGFASVRVARHLLSEQAALFVAVSWEKFIHDLFVCFISDDPSSFRTYLHIRGIQSLKSKLGRVADKAILNIPQNLTKEQIDSALDPERRNKTFNSASAMVDEAALLLSKEHSTRFNNLSPSDLAVLDGLLSMRNYLSHRSYASYKKMKDCLKDRHLPASLRWNVKKRQNIGMYLSSRYRDNVRLIALMRHVLEIADHLVQPLQGYNLPTALKPRR